MSQTGDIDIIISIHVLRFGSRLEVEAHVFTAGLQRRGMEPESFRYLGTSIQASLDLSRVILVSLQIDFHSGQWGACAWLPISRRQRHRGGSALGSFRVASQRR